MIDWLPRPVHRSALRIAHRLRHHWRKLAKPQLRGVCVILRDGDGRILFARHAYGPPEWSLPGGGVARNEAPEAAALRELDEELGVKPGALRLLGTVDETISGAPHTAWVFTATIDDLPEPDGREIVEVCFAPLDDPPRPTGAIALRRLRQLLQTAD